LFSKFIAAQMDTDCL